MLETWPHENAWITDPLINYWLFVLLVLWPVIKITKRTGVAFWKVFPILIPYVGMVIVAGLLAHSSWEHNPNKRRTEK